jgi:hypothetical protein
MYDRSRSRGGSVTAQLYIWRWGARLPERHGQLFRVLVRGSLNSCLIEFVTDSGRYVTSRNAPGASHSERTEECLGM